MSVALKKSPLSRVKDEFGGKDKLVDKILGVIDSGEESKDDLRKRLLGVANGKLIRLFSVATRTKSAGGHDKLAATAAEKLKHGKDKDYVTKLGEYSDARLLDMVSASERAAGAAAKKPAKAAARPAAKKPPAAQPAAKKGAKSAAKSPAKARKKG
jgi:pyruvate/2-oxoglutarate dehydrogenase complex dihydrolipoamide acyltransferase (E2) component